MEKKKLNIPCAKCKTTFEYYSSEFRPFCSEKCQMQDLGMWLNESYTVPSEEALTESDLEHVLREKEKEFYEH
ncbi:DNA gyrase inhibitor YacG [Bacteriovorax sp. Seq25_V]|uniref:DNA gyrase inhibitor YacG n=1 Tax=Bacteriovorax sp. Seq25_V TaxID=1201288 RepID=UPI00038A4FA2|nr:DNA gyrase inhibitor YacG [Bacteriovorax sp. Seq25_V]EQC47414.1 PF03884 domain protein [Bacteriovorax sp. Seq25_V]